VGDSLEFAEIDGYLTSGSVSGGARRIGARQWRIGPIAAADWVAPELAADSARERGRFAQHRILYACIGREEKLNSVPFLKSVAAILKAVPEAGFLWTGRQRHPVIQATMEAEGVAQRCYFIGWVNTRLYAQVIDVFLDSFPFPCAYTLYEAMAAGKPAVLYASEESAEMGARALIEPLLCGTEGTEQDQKAAREIFRQAGENLFLLASDADDYVRLGVRLARHAAFMRLAGSAGSAFVQRFMTDRARFARIYGEHIASAVKEKIAGAA
jgi:predicted O-linked N-acetylglucosamine transferase (SPINDLY family)